MRVSLPPYSSEFVCHKLCKRARSDTIKSWDDFFISAIFCTVRGSLLAAALIFGDILVCIARRQRSISPLHPPWKSLAVVILAFLSRSNLCALQVDDVQRMSEYFNFFRGAGTITNIESKYLGIYVVFYFPHKPASRQLKLSDLHHPGPYTYDGNMAKG